MSTATYDHPHLYAVPAPGEQQAGNAGLRAVRELAAIVLVCSKAIEGVVDVLAGQRSSTAYGQRDFLYDEKHYD